MNVFTATGNLGKDAETRYTQSGTAIAVFSIAVKSGYGDREATSWIRCNLWGKRAESGLVQYLTKGQQVAVSGELTVNEYNDKDGNKRTSVDLNIRDIDLIGGKGNTTAQSTQKSSNDPFADSPDFGDVPVDDDIPF